MGIILCRVKVWIPETLETSLNPPLMLKNHQIYELITEIVNLNMFKYNDN